MQSHLQQETGIALHTVLFFRDYYLDNDHIVYEKHSPYASGGIRGRD
jgi:hypothetical protein